MSCIALYITIFHHSLKQPSGPLQVSLRQAGSFLCFSAYSRTNSSFTITPSPGPNNSMRFKEIHARRTFPNLEELQCILVSPRKLSDLRCMCVDPHLGYSESSSDGGKIKHLSNFNAYLPAHLLYNI